MNDREKIEAIKNVIEGLRMDMLFAEPLEKITEALYNINKIVQQKEDMDAYADDLANSI